VNPLDAKAILEDARPVPHRDRYKRDEATPLDCGCRKNGIKPGCVRHDPQERKAA
jgi:hypothetical protein